MKNAAVLLVFSFICNMFFSFDQAFASDEENYDYYYQDFLVSAYYSPLPNQARYMRGSYEADIRLNGRGTNGADGTEVYMGMLAAPKTYSFGTQIEIPELGIGEVHDRGGAIIEKKNYHRIDVWMGHGDQGLTRALNWGMRQVTGKVYFEKAVVAQTLDYTVISAAMPKIAEKKRVEKKAQLISKNLSQGSLDSQVVKLKEVLQKLGYFAYETQNNYFGVELEKAVIRFQKDQGIILNTQSYGAGHVGLKTREAIQAAVEQKNIIASTPQEKVDEIRMQIHSGIGKNSSKESVKALQIVLANMGYYQGVLNGEYSDDTIAAVFAFQKDNEVLASTADAGAGSFGPKTHAALERVFAQRLEKMKQFPVAKMALIEGEIQEVSIDQTLSKTSDVSEYPSYKFKEYSSQFALGDTGQKVENLQKVLAKEGFLEHKYVTGYYGPITYKAVEMAQGQITDSK